MGAPNLFKMGPFSEVNCLAKSRMDQPPGVPSAPVPARATRAPAKAAALAAPEIPVTRDGAARRARDEAW